MAAASYADLTGADLTGAEFGKADLRWAELTDADLTDVGLTEADLTDARWPKNAPVPEGWKLDTGSGRLRAADSGADPTKAT